MTGSSRRGKWPVGLQTFFATAAIVIGGFGACSAPADSQPVRLIDRLSDTQQLQFTIDGTTRRVLPAFRQKQIIPLSPAPSHPILRFSAGLMGGPPTPTIRFQAIVRFSDGSSRPVYDRTLDSPGWYDEQVDLNGLNLTGAVLVLKREAVVNLVLKREAVGRTPRQELMRGAWGEPMLLPAVPAERESFVLVSIDTLRADRVGAYEPSAKHTPVLDEFAKTGVLYENAYSPSTWTLPSHFSMLRGVPASRAPQRMKDAPDDDTTPLATVFRDAGYLTAGFTGGGFVSATFGFSEGFDSYYSYQEPHRTEEGCWPDRFDGPEVVRRTEQWLRENGSRPFFLFVHTYDAHDRCPFQGQGFAKGHLDSSPKGRKRMSEYYDKVISKADGVLASVLAGIASLNTKQRITVTVTSDHGDAFWEHGSYGHGCFAKPYEPLVQVPLIVRPGSRHDGGRRVATPVSVGSIAPTLLALAGLPRPANMELLPLPGLGLEGSQKEGPIYSGCGDWLAIRNGSYKLITKRKGSRKNELYDLEQDPGELENVASKHTETAAEFRKLARVYWGQPPSKGKKKTRAKKPVIDEDTRERLRALGYSE